MIYAFSGGTSIELTLEASQMSIEDFRDEDGHEGLTYSISKDGSVEVDKDQVTTDELGLTADGSEIEELQDQAGDGKVTNIRAPRVTKAEKEAKRLADLEQEQLDKDPSVVEIDKDELPF